MKASFATRPMASTPDAAERLAALVAEAALHTEALDAYRAAGCPIFDEEPESLADIELDCPIRRERPTELSLAMRWVGLGPGRQELLAYAQTCRRDYEPCPRHWYVVRDVTRVAPLHATGAACESFARSWRESMPDLRGAEMLVKVVPGAPIEAAMWSEAKLTDSQVRQWCDRFDDGERFEPLFEWHTPDDYQAVHLRPATASAGAFRGGAVVTSTPSTGLRTGIAALDAQFRGSPLLPAGARVCISGPPGNFKTLLALELAEQAAAQGAFVVWLAYDEARERVMARRLQRAGLAPAAAQALPAADVARLAAVDLFVVEPAEPLELLWQQAATEAGDAPIVVVVDSIQKLQTVAGAGKGEREGIDAALGAVQQCQRQYGGTFVFTSEVARGSGETKGSVGIDFAATLHLAVRRSGSTLAVKIKKSRDGSDESFKVKVDAERQRLAQRTAAPVAVAMPAWDQVRACLADALAASGRELERKLEGVVPRAALRACLKERCAAGDLSLTEDGYRLA